jgi:hypothetical protein
MQLDALLDRCQRLESRAASLYRSFAAASRSEPALCALWTELARDEQEHAHSIEMAHFKREATEGWRTQLDGWEEALTDIEDRLAAAEQLGPGATTAQRFAAALDLEASELEALRQVLLATSGFGIAPQADHVLKLAGRATAFCDDPHVSLQAALLRARARLNAQIGEVANGAPR